MAPVGLVALRVEHEDPFAARHLVKSAFGNQHAILRLSQLQVDVVALSASYLPGTPAGEDQLRAETAVAHLGEHLAQRQPVSLSVAAERAFQPGADAVDVMFVYLRLNLEVRQVVHLPDFLSRRDAGPQLHVQLSQLAVDFRAHLQAVLPLADKGQVALHVS